MSKREINVDLFRVIATLFVIMLHIVVQGGIIEKATPDGSVYWVASFMEVISYCAVNCFALISGYVMVNRTVKSKNIISLWFQILFYSLLFTALFFLFVPETRSLRTLLFSVLPVIGNRWWYVSSYFVLFFSIPILNAGINQISKKTHEIFLIVILIGIGIIDCIIPMDAFALNDGYSPIWLIILYLFGAYIKKYDLKQRTTALKSMLCFLTIIILTFLTKPVIHFATKTFLGQVKFDTIFISYTSITIVLASIFLFLFCLNIKTSKSTEKIVNFFAPATLGVYLIHVHPLVFQHIIKNAFVPFVDMAPVVMLLCVLATTLVIFLLCSVIELLRIHFFKLIKVNKLCEIADKKVMYFYDKIFKE